MFAADFCGDLNGFLKKQGGGESHESRAPEKKEKGESQVFHDGHSKFDLTDPATSSKEFFTASEASLRASVREEFLQWATEAVRVVRMLIGICTVT